MSEIFTIESLDLDARGIARRDGKTIFVEGALPGETVRAQVFKKKNSYEIARTEAIIDSSYLRVRPACPSFGICGGCAMQHLDPLAQVAIKQRALEDCFKHIAKLQVPQVLAPMYGPIWHYRYRARLSVRYVVKKGTVLIGFHERKSSYVTDMLECLVLPKKVSDLLPLLRDLIGSLSIKERIPQLEIAVGSDTIVLVLRHLEPLSKVDLQQIERFALTHKVSFWSQFKGPDTAKPINAQDESELAYDLPQFALRMPYKPTDFTQVNYFVNRSLIGRALSLLEVQRDDRVADLFCGLGNFSLPLATQARQVVGIEGSKSLTQRAQDNAKLQGLAHKTEFITLNLFEIDVDWLRGLGYFDRILIDPPREGAQAIAIALSKLAVSERPKRIVYVSCNPATLARDAGILVNYGGYGLLSVGVINMFPHTAHVESIAVFEDSLSMPVPALECVSVDANVA